MINQRVSNILNVRTHCPPRSKPSAIAIRPIIPYRIIPVHLQPHLCTPQQKSARIVAINPAWVNDRLEFQRAKGNLHVRFSRFE